MCAARKARRCQSCRTRWAIYREKSTGDEVCATCMQAIWAAFGKGPEDFKRIKHDN